MTNPDEGSFVDQGVGDRDQLQRLWTPHRMNYLAEAPLRRDDTTEAQPFTDIPTLSEQGLAGLESSSWSGLMAPAGTPEEVLERINADVNRTLELRSLQDAFAKSGIVSLGGTRDAFGQFLNAEMSRQADVIRKAGIKPG